MALMLWMYRMDSKWAAMGVPGFQRAQRAGPARRRPRGVMAR
jgi:hypothetical protein